MSVIIKSLGPELTDDFLYFFDNLAFSDNPEWAGCYCHFYHFKGKPTNFVLLIIYNLKNEILKNKNKRRKKKTG